MDLRRQLQPTCDALGSHYRRQDQNRMGLKRFLGNQPYDIYEASGQCVHWVQDTFRIISQGGRAYVSGLPKWELVRRQAMAYIDYKRTAHRFDGQSSAIMFDRMKPATWDMLISKKRLSLESCQCINRPSTSNTDNTSHASSSNTWDLSLLPEQFATMLK